MALNVTAASILSGVRQFADIGGTTALVRHPDANIYDYINRALGSLHRKLTEAMPDQRYLLSDTITTADGTTLYDLPDDFDHLISVDLTANGAKRWLVSYEMHERPALTDPSATFSGIPNSYRLRGTQIEYLPTPSAAYTSTLWYCPAATQWATDGSDASATFDTISRLDDYLIAYAARFVAVRDKNAILIGACEQLMSELLGEIGMIARARDKNSPPRIVDERCANRWGRSQRLPRRWR